MQTSTVIAGLVALGAALILSQLDRLKPAPQPVKVREKEVRRRR